MKVVAAMLVRSSHLSITEYFVITALAKASFAESGKHRSAPEGNRISLLFLALYSLPLFEVRACAIEHLGAFASQLGRPSCAQVAFPP
jgi:hypothetical protein